MNYKKLTKAGLITLLELREKPVEVSSPRRIFDFLRPYGKKEQEHFIVLMVDGALKVKNLKVVTIGTINRTLVHPREVFAPAIENRATGIIIAHNHPSGNLEPSNEDLNTTQSLKNAGDILGIKVFDHVIFSGDDYHSMFENGEF